MAIFHKGTLFSIILFTFSETSITIPIGINIPNMAAKVARYLSEYIYQL
jgi:hypothetical protein